MSFVAQLEMEKAVTSHNRTWGAYDAKGGRAVNSAMKYAVNALTDLAVQEATGNTEVRFSLAKRVAIIEKAVLKFRKACEKHPDSGLEDTAVRDAVHGYLSSILLKSGVEYDMARRIVATMPIDDI